MEIQGNNKSFEMVWYVQRRAINALVRKSDLIQVEGTKRCRRRPKITLIEVVKRTC